MLEHLLLGKALRDRPMDDGTVLLMHFDGGNKSKSFRDECGHPISNTGDFELSTTTSVFGSASLKGSGGMASQLTTPDKPELRLTGDFTIQFWLNMPADVNAFLLGKGISVIQHYSGKLYVQVENQNYFIIVPFGVYGAWRHFAMTRQGTTWRAFVHGKLLATVVNAKGFGDNASQLCIGNNTAITSVPLVGNIDELHIDNTKAIYTADFTPPTSPFV